MQKIKMTSEKIINYHFLQGVSCKFCNFKKALKSLQNSFNESLPFLRKQRQQKNPATLQDQKRLSEFYFLFSYSNSRHVNTLLGCQALTLSRQNVWVVAIGSSTPTTKNVPELFPMHREKLSFPQFIHAYLSYMLPYLKLF